jgi:disulfide bond formation protein DsbB
MSGDIMISAFLYRRDCLAILCFLSGFVPLSLALISQYGFDLYPCELCIYQRYPYGIVMLVAALALILRRTASFFSAIIILIVITHLTNAGIAFFHVGVEEKWWTFGECSADLDMSSIDSLKKSLFSAPNVRCDEPQFYFLGLTMAGWNVIYTLGAAIFFLILFMRFKDNEKK